MLVSAPDRRALGLPSDERAFCRCDVRPEPAAGPQCRRNERVNFRISWHAPDRSGYWPWDLPDFPTWQRSLAGVIVSSFWLCSHFGSRGRCIVPWQADNRGDRCDSDYNRLSGSHASRHSAGWVVRASCRVASWAEVRGSKARNLCCDTRTTTGPARSGGRAVCTAACLAGVLPWFDSILRTPCCDDQRANSSVELACRESCKVYSSASGFFSRRFFLGSYP